MNGITKDSSQTYESLCDTQKRYDYERQLFEEKLKAKEAELALERNKTENLTTMIGGRREMPVSMQQGLQENTFLQKELTELREKAARYQQLEAEARQLREKVNEFEKERQGKTVVSGAVEHKIKHFQDREAAHLLDLENLARGFAHRVRNYLGIISGTVQMVVSRSKISDEVKEQLDIVEQNARENAYIDRRVFIAGKDP